MKFPVEKFITPFIERQFPEFYQEEGPNFILFVKAYYEWLEQQDNPVGAARSLYDYRDIDNTLDQFLNHFVKKYLYGIPSEVIINKRLLLKHVLDVYRSKGSVQCYKLLFRMLYDQDVEIYLPGEDMLRISDGTWIEPRYLEITNTENLENFVGKVIFGLSSSSTGLVESYIREPINQSIIGVLYLSNILPRNGNFIVGEKIAIQEDLFNSNTIDYTSSPTVIGSLDSLEIISGGQDFKIGDILKIANKSITNNNIISFGIDGKVRVTELQRGFGSLTFDIVSKGFGYMANSLIFLYRGDGDVTGNGASFSLGAIAGTQSIQYNSDLICDYANLTLNITQFNFPSNPTGNVTSTFNSVLTFPTSTFGSISSLTSIVTGNSYTQPAFVFVQSTQLSNNLVGNVSYTTLSNTVTGTSTIFLSHFTNGSIIRLQSNSSLSNTIEYVVIRSVNSDTDLTLYGPPSFSSTSSAQYRCAPVILPSNFALYESVMFRTDGTVNGLNANVTAYPSVGNNIVKAVTAINSGKGFVEDNIVIAYRFGAVNTPIVVLGGNNYSNGETLVFIGGGTTAPALGYITTNTTGGVASTTLTYEGSGYLSIPSISVQTANGSGAYLTTTLKEFNTFSEVRGRVRKTGLGRGLGYWSTTRGFLNADKYIQDSYFYQDFSYQIKAASSLERYKNIFYNTFHTAGTELFGRFVLTTKKQGNSAIVYENSSADVS